MSSAEDYRYTRKLKKSRPNEAVKISAANMHYVFMLCPVCGYVCTVGISGSGQAKKLCSRCGKSLMQEK